MPRTTRTDPTAYKYPYLLKDLEVVRQNQGWGVSNTMTAEWCTAIVSDAIAAHGKPEIINSDQGSQFTSEVYIDLLKAKGIQISMDGKGRAVDNIFIERLWRSVKYEHIYLHIYEDGLSLFKGLKQYFTFYNEERRHQSLAYVTPESLYMKAAA